MVIQPFSRNSDPKEKPRCGLATGTGAVVQLPRKKAKDTMKLPQSYLRYQSPCLFDWADNRELRSVDPRVRWVANRCRVSFATAQTIIANAGFSDGERR